MTAEEANAIPKRMKKAFVKEKANKNEQQLWNQPDSDVRDAVKMMYRVFLNIQGTQGDIAVASLFYE